MLQKMVDDNNIDIDAEDLSMTKDIINSDRTKQMKYERSIKFILKIPFLKNKL